MANAQFGCQFPRAPVGRIVFGRAPGALQSLCFQLRSVLQHLPSLLTPVKTGQPLNLKSLLPEPDRVHAAAHVSGYLTLPLAFREPENDIRPANVLGRETAAAKAGLKCGFSGSAHFKLGWHAYTLSHECIRSPGYNALVWCLTFQSPLKPMPGTPRG